MTRLNVSIVNHQVGIGGAEVALLRLTEALGGRHDLTVFLPGDGELARALGDRGVRVARVGAPAASLTARRGDSAGTALRILGDGLRWPSSIRTLAAALESADVVVTGSTKAHLYGGWAARRARRPLVWWLHDTVDRTTFGPLSRMLILQSARRLPDRIVAVSETAASSLGFAPGEPRLRVIHNGIRTGLEEPGVGRAFKTERPRVGWIGRLIPSKGPDLFLRAAVETAARIPEAFFVLVGGVDPRDPGYAAHLEETARSGGIADRVEFTGWRENLDSVFRTFDVLVFTSPVSESLPNVILEAMARGVPVAAFGGAGVDEIAGGSDALMRVPMGDTGALADAVCALIERPDLRRDFAARGTARVRETFGWDRWVEAWDRELAEVAVEGNTR